MTMSKNKDKDNGHNSDPARRGSVITPSAGAAMGVGVGAALTAATGDGWWIGLFAGFGAFVATTLNALHGRCITLGRQSPRLGE